MPIAFLNAAVAEALGEFEEALGARTAGGASLQDAVLDVVREAVVATKPSASRATTTRRSWSRRRASVACRT